MKDEIYSANSDIQKTATVIAETIVKNISGGAVVPEPAIADAGKVVGVDANGDYELQTPRTDAQVKALAKDEVEGATSGTIVDALGLNAQGKLVKGALPSGGTKLYRHILPMTSQGTPVGNLQVFNNSNVVINNSNILNSLMNAISFYVYTNERKTIITSYDASEQYFEYSDTGGAYDEIIFGSDTVTELQ